MQLLRSRSAAGQAPTVRRTAKRGVASVGWRAVAVVLALAAASPAASAQGTVRRHAPPFWRAWRLSAGFGAEYGVSGKGWLRGYRLRLAIVGSRTIAGKQWYWLEVSAHATGAKKALVNKALFSVEAGSVAFSRGVALVPGHPPMALPQDWLWSWAQGDLQAASGYIHVRGGTSLGLWHSGPAVYPNQPLTVGVTYDPGYFTSLRMYNAPYLEMPGAVDLGPSVVTTPAGTFHCEHWRFGHHGPDVWISTGAGPFGLVKAVYTDRRPPPPPAVTTMVLTRETKDAKGEIRGRLVRTDPADLWGWIYDQRYTLLQSPVPNLGLPLPVP